MTRILFVCHGNICRSPMAEFCMKALVKRAGVSQDFQIDSAAVSAEELGNPVYPPAARLLRAKGLDPAGKRARQIVRADYDDYDLILGMDEGNLRGMLRIFGGDPGRKVRRLMDYTVRPRNVADPWYTGDFDAAWRDVSEGCAALLDSILTKNAEKQRKNP